jgi:hypothetical protein
MAIGSFIVGSAISRSGRARIFPLVGGTLAGLLCLLVAYVGLGQSIIFDVVCTTMLGAAFGAQINPMLVIVQNGLEVRDIGAGVSGMTFFRSLAGAFGVAVFTTFLIGRLAAGAALVPGHEKLGADLGVALLRRDADQGFDNAQTLALLAVREHAFSLVFVFAALFAAIAVAAVFCLNERPLRANSGRL